MLRVCGGNVAGVTDRFDPEDLAGLDRCDGGNVGVPAVVEGNVLLPRTFLGVHADERGRHHRIFLELQPSLHPFSRPSSPRDFSGTIIFPLDDLRSLRENKNGYTAKIGMVGFYKPLQTNSYGFTNHMRHSLSF